MRPVLAILIWVVLVGGLTTYMHVRQRSNPAGTFEVHEASGAFAVEVTHTFDAEPDPFALQIDTQTGAPALLLRVNGAEVLRRTERVERGIPVRVEPVSALIQGHNEIYIEANPPLDQAERSMAVRIRILRDGQPVADQSFWSESGSKIAAAFPVEIVPAKAPEAQPHGH